MWKLTAVHMHVTELGAARQGRHRLAGVEQATGIEGRLDGVELGQFEGIELHAHLVDLLDADAVLASNGAADLHAQFEDLAAHLFGTFQLAFLVRVIQNQWVQIAVTGMEYIGDG